MDPLPAWWTFFWPPGFSQTNIFFLLGLNFLQALCNCVAFATVSWPVIDFAIYDLSNSYLIYGCFM